MYILQLNIYNSFSNYLAGKKKSHSKFRKFYVIQTKLKEHALQFESELEATQYAQSSPLTLNYFAVKI
jgi:hypothetical protein